MKQIDCGIGSLPRMLVRFQNEKADRNYPSANLHLAYVEERVKPDAYRR